ncbi:MAG: hypothetical protein Q9169_004042 [Polycauliona sp. 2 TL-2023]
MASFTGKVCVITGGASGIGQATAQLLAAGGASVSIADVQQEALTATADSVRKANPDAKILTKVVDVTSSEQVNTWIQETLSQFGRIDCAANLAGIIGKGANTSVVGDYGEDDFDKVIAVNVKGVFNCMKAQLNSMKEQGSGTIVNASSVAGLNGYPKNIAYCASKHAVIGMTKTAAKEYGEKNIRVNAIAPGPIDTPMIKSLYGSDAAKAIIGMVPLQRYGRPEEVTKLIMFLLGEDSSFCSGGVYGIDGGLTG